MEYLENNLLPLIMKINAKITSSDILFSLGGSGELISQQSLLIQFANYIETFFNTVITHSTTNLIQESNIAIINGEEKQVDHLFLTKENKVCYLESKCNLNFDSEKVKASNKKVKLLANHFSAVNPTYFVPVRRVPKKEDIIKYSKKGISVVGVEWLETQIDLPFTTNQYFEFLKDICGPLMKEKGLILN